jgi:hypothetical protein
MKSEEGDLSKQCGIVSGGEAVTVVNTTFARPTMIDSSVTDLIAACASLARRPGAPTRELPRLQSPALARLRLAIEQPEVALLLFDALEHEAGSVSRWAYCLGLDLGEPCGRALARALPGIFAQIERDPPESAGALRRLDGALCAAIALVERLAPERLPGLFRALMARRGLAGASPWWTFRAWQRITEAMQSLVRAGDETAMDMVLELVLSGSSAPHGTPEHWRGAWAAQQLVPHLPGLRETPREAE